MVHGERETSIGWTIVTAKSVHGRLALGYLATQGRCINLRLVAKPSGEIRRGSPLLAAVNYPDIERRGAG